MKTGVNSCLDTRLRSISHSRLSFSEESKCVYFKFNALINGKRGVLIWNKCAVCVA